MPRVAFWNVNTGESSDSRRFDTIEGGCYEGDPDLLVLEEVSSMIGPPDAGPDPHGRARLRQHAHYAVEFSGNAAVGVVRVN